MMMVRVGCNAVEAADVLLEAEGVAGSPLQLVNRKASASGAIETGKSFTGRSPEIARWKWD
jgi:hypothetical protein